ncbi:hypothetical protein KBX73_10080 [Acetobacter persici]|uniref:phage protease n=1 Tax=Acetobacter persici TaxID=1076596 RepID=UPI0020CDF911|nr:phage protease [Acetobacter persici]MCP9320112.1 hypothetical protein [Acetobacter persici]
MQTARAFQTIQLSAEGVAPEWIHLLPAGTFKAYDGRGPFVVRDAQALMASSMEHANGKLALDENHATDTAAKIGLPAHAMGWIVALDERSDGIWGRVEWTGPGRAAMQNHAYRGISPVIDYTKDGVVTRIKRASLTNDPALTTLSHLFHGQTQETRMDLAELARRLGLPETATQADVDQALAAARGQTALHGNLTKLLGLDANADATALLTGLRARLEGATAQAATVETLQTQVATLQADAALTKAETVVDEAARGGRVISKELRTELVALHISNPEMADKIIGQLPKLPAGQIAGKPAGGGTTVLHGTADAGADDKTLAALDATFKVTADERKTLGEAHAY